IHHRPTARRFCRDAAVPLARAESAAGRARHHGPASRRSHGGGSMRGAMNTVIFACIHNAGRSQMAAAFFNAMADHSKARAVSAGTQPAERIHPEVVAAMDEIGIDLSKARPQRLTTELAKTASVLVTMGCGDACPVV